MARCPRHMFGARRASLPPYAQIEGMTDAPLDEKRVDEGVAKKPPEKASEALVPAAVPIATKKPPTKATLAALAAPAVIQEKSLILGGQTPPPGPAAHVVTGRAMDVGVAAETLRRVNRTRQVVSLVSQAIIRSYEEDALHGEVCRFLVTFGGYLMAWIGLADEKPTKVVRPVGHAGVESNFLEALKITWSNDLANQSPTSRAIREQRPYVARNIPTDPRLVGLRPEAKLYGYTATCALPIQFAGHGMGVLTIHAAEPDAFGSEEVSLLRELANDLSAGVVALREKAKRQALEEETHLAESRYRRIIENAHEGIFECTPDGALITVNLALANLLGYDDPAELMAVEPASILTHVHPEDAAALQFTHGRDAPPMHLRLRTKEGGWVWVAVSMQNAEGATGPQRVAFVQDMTLVRAQREANARLASVVDAADEAIVGTDLRGAVSDWNEGAVRLFGYKAREVIGKPLAEFLIPPDRQEENRRVMEAMARGESVPRFETVRLCKEKKLIHTSVTVNPIFAGEGELVGSTIVEHDITQARMSAAARRAKELEDAEVMKLKALERIRKTFMSEASHELNTPLTPLRIHVEALAESKDLTPEGRAHLTVIERNLLRLCNLVRDMLEASRLETGRFKLEVRDTAVATLIEEVTQGLAETAKRGRVKLEVDIPSRLVARADSHRVGQVLYNLLTNAISFTKEGGRVTVSAHAEKDMVVVRVRDTGVGLTADQITQLFQPFARPHEATGTAPKGTGLGLFISKGIIEQHGGRIWAESPGPGAGSSFCFTLPVGRTESRNPMSGEGPQRQPRPATAPKPTASRAARLKPAPGASPAAQVLESEGGVSDATL